MAGDTYDAVTICLPCRIHSSAMDGWNATGRRLLTQHGHLSAPTHSIRCDPPNDNIGTLDEPRDLLSVFDVQQTCTGIREAPDQILSFCA